MSEKNTDIRLIKLNSYVRPVVVERLGKKWVTNGPNNIFYKTIIDRFNGSPTNAAIITSYIDLIYGNGIAAKNKDLPTWIKFLTILSPKDLRRIIADFELFGEASFQVIKTKDGKDLSGIYHIPKQLVIPSIENDEGEIESYWYSKDWSNTYKYVPEEFPAFGTSGSIQIYCIKPYKAGKNYFSDPDYLAAMPYAEMEEELANFYINSIKNGLSAGYIVNIPDGGVLTPEQKDKLEQKIKDKLTGSPNAMNFVISFNGIDADITIVPFPVNEQQHKQWEYLTSESRQQIMTGHRVVSPMLFGIKDSTGFGNNADELDTAEAQTMKRVIQPKQREILEAFEEVLQEYDMNLDLFFRPLTELPATAEPAVELSVKKKEETEEYRRFIECGEIIDLDQWELVDEREVDYEQEKLIDMQLAANTVAIPNAKSAQDTDIYKVRYKFTGDTPGERWFCQKMMRQDKIFRKEDIVRLADKDVNPGWGPKGIDYYDIWLYKGGGNCHHKWNRVIYAKKDRTPGVDVRNPNADEVTAAQTRKENGFIPPTNDKRGYIKPINMPYQGFLPTNPRFNTPKTT